LIDSVKNAKYTDAGKIGTLMLPYQLN